ncbi:tetratricopeptide repeat protein [Actinoplanes sp. TRM 88003]|uniref:Tetratricopeptide repeat protein n=1 Tax=Paractinoplanes aksuensis TaxID=2939490 RepID=A0ABT1DX92_9ACTN|nr:BTAD domain-containing putative transcriptional regulator [Actinoplanes aksuensis]MCO8275502.1 tetratricopeptide repeat protein [Actinoplanes aksuensis]
MSPTVGDKLSFCFGVLGPVQVLRSGVEVDLGARQQRLILALLLANAGQPVGIGNIVEVLWGERPPASAVNVVHRYVGTLRRLFEPALPARSSGRWLLGDAAGYRMQVDPFHLDLSRLRMLAEQARSDASESRWTEAMASFESALALWRGPCGGAAELVANDHLTFDAIDHECAGLAREATALALRLDKARAVLPVLRRMAEHRPLDEALQARLVLAVSADGQQAEAIAHYQNVRRRLADELGVDPGEELREAYQQVLRQENAAPVSPPGGTGTPAPPPGDPAPRLTTVLPAQLPADLAHFTGRDDAQSRTLSLVNGHILTQASMPVLAIDGIPGIGKTSLAIHLAHQLTDAYPDGQLYVDLQGFDPEQSVLHPAQALQGFLNALGVPDADIPVSHHARSGLYRSVLAGRRILVVLDNAHSVEQVRPLLPGSPGCLALVTSRKRLTGLATAHGAHLMTLDVLSVEDARGFLTSRIGSQRTSAESEAVDEVIERCGRLPLALAVVASRALTHPDHKLIEIARELRDAQGSLDGFSTDDIDNDIRAIFSWSYRTLGPPAARMFRLLSLHPGPDIATPAMASLAGVALTEARLLVGELVRTGLLAEHQVGRFWMHDLIRAYAQELVQGHDDELTQVRAFERLTAHYRQSAHEADRLLGPSIMLDPPPAMADVVTVRPGDGIEAGAWLNAERQVLKAVVQRLIEGGDVAAAWRLTVNLHFFNQREGWCHDWAATSRACLQAATSAGDDLGSAFMARSLSGAEMMLGHYESALQHLDRSLELFTALGHSQGQALVYRNLGQVTDLQGRHQEAIGYFERAVQLMAAQGDLVSQVLALGCLADAHTSLGHFEISMDLINRALPIADALQSIHGQGFCHEIMAKCLQAKGDLPAARRIWGKAVGIFRRSEWRMNTVSCLLHLGDTALAMGDPAGAREAWQEALDLTVHLRLPEVTELEDRLSRLEHEPAPVGGGR